MYRNPKPLTEEIGRRRIYAPVAYPAVRTERFVPIVLPEAFRLASWFPVVWRRHADPAGGPPTLGVLRSLLADGRGQPAGSPQTPSSLPLVLQAYPFLIDDGQSGTGHLSVAFDDAGADQPTDAGSPVVTLKGTVARATELRFRMLAQVQTHRALTEDVTRALLDADLFQNWPLAARTPDGTITVDDLLVVKPPIFDTGQLGPIVGRFGAEAARFLSAHRISLFRAGTLVAAAQAARDPELDRPPAAGQSIDPQALMAALASLPPDGSLPGEPS